MTMVPVMTTERKFCLTLPQARRPTSKEASIKDRGPGMRSSQKGLSKCGCRKGNHKLPCSGMFHKPKQKEAEDCRAAEDLDLDAELTPTTPDIWFRLLLAVQRHLGAAAKTTVRYCSKGNFDEEFRPLAPKFVTQTNRNDGRCQGARDDWYGGGLVDIDEEADEYAYG